MPKEDLPTSTGAPSLAYDRTMLARDLAMLVVRRLRRDRAEISSTLVPPSVTTPSTRKRPSPNESATE